MDKVPEKSATQLKKNEGVPKLTFKALKAMPDFKVLFVTGEKRQDDTFYLAGGKIYKIHEFQPSELAGMGDFAFERSITESSAEDIVKFFTNREDIRKNFEVQTLKRYIEEYGEVAAMKDLFNRKRNLNTIGNNLVDRKVKDQDTEDVYARLYQFLNSIPKPTKESL